MKKLLALGIGVLTLTTMMGAARAVDMPVKQEGRVWIDQNFLLAFTPNWSLTTMPGARVEFARTREGSAGMQFIELFFGPNYTYKTGNFTLKASLWYYYMGYPQRGRIQGTVALHRHRGLFDAAIAPSTYCTSTYNLSHNLEIVPRPNTDLAVGRSTIGSFP